MAEQSETYNEALAKVKTILRTVWITPEQCVELCLAIIEGLIRGDCERRLKNDVESERRTFDALSRSREEPQRWDLADFVFRRWVKTSPKLFAAAYRLGARNAAAEITKNNVMRAANGRRLIGATSRAKVAEAAKTLRHLSKERAAASMAELVNLVPGTIRRYLSQLFPGDKWADKP